MDKGAGITQNLRDSQERKCSGVLKTPGDPPG